nr:hypothetical protein CFP56_06218 [Quercus suber]
MTTNQGHDHVRVDVEPTRLDIAIQTPSNSHEKVQISRNLNPTNFKEHLREINAAITSVAPNLRAHRSSKLFRFESMWLRDDECKDVVNDAWERGRSMGIQHQFTQCLDECRRSLFTWNKTKFGHVGQKISALQKKLRWLEGRYDGLVRMEEIHVMKMELNRMMGAEEDMWH